MSCLPVIFFAYLLKPNFDWLSLQKLNLTLKIALSFLFRKLFDGVSQHGAGHFLVMHLQEAFFGLQMALADFAQHPACGFMDQILPIGKQHFGNLQNILSPAF